MKWFNYEIGEGENVTVIYPDLQTFNQFYTHYVIDGLKGQPQGLFHDSGGSSNSSSNKHNETSLPRIMLIATFYETIDTAKHTSVQ